MLGPTPEFENNITNIRECEKCKIAFLKGNPKEVYSYYIGNHRVEIFVNISKAHCPGCGAYWELKNAREFRNNAFEKSIDDFWRDEFREAGVFDNEIASAKFIVSRLMIKMGKDKKRLIASELGRWLADCAFINK